MNYRCVICDSSDCKNIADVRLININYSSSRENINTKKRNYIICKSCGFISIYPRYDKNTLKEYYKNISTSQFNDNVLKNYTRLFYKATIDYLDGIIGLKGKKVFDVGASQGLLLKMLKNKYGCEVNGLDPSIECVEFAKKEFGIDLINNMLEDIDLEKKDFSYLKKSFDVVLSLHVLDLISEPKEFLNTLIKLAKPGGYIYIDVPSWFVERYPNPRYGNTLGAIHHNHFSLISIMKFFEKEGCTLLAAYTELSESNYPTQRFLARKLNYIEGTEAEFRKYFDSRHRNNYEKAMSKILNYLKQFKKIIFYGGGGDLLRFIEIHKNFFENNKDRFQCVDHNKQKVGKKLSFLKIEPVKKCLSRARDAVVLSTSTSQMVQRHMKSDFDMLNTNLKFDNLFSDTMFNKSSIR